jgi:hypothetical protein
VDLSNVPQLTPERIAAIFPRLTPEQIAAIVPRLTQEQIAAIMPEHLPVAIIPRLTPEQIAAIVPRLNQVQIDAIMPIGMDYVVRQYEVTAQSSDEVKKNYGVGAVLERTKNGFITIRGRLTGGNSSNKQIRIDTKIEEGSEHIYQIDTRTVIGSNNGSAITHTSRFCFLLEFDNNSIPDGSFIFEYSGMHDANMRMYYTIKGKAKFDLNGRPL